MLILVKKLLTALNKKNILYCQIKSNKNLFESLNGEGDIDLLIAAKDRFFFEKIIKKLQFQKALQPDWKSEAFVYHYYGLDADTGIIVHLHLFYKLVAGGSILKNYYFPYEDIFFNNMKSYDLIRISIKEIDIIFFIIRKYLEHTSIIELYLIYKDYDNIKKQLQWLITNADKKKIRLLLQKHFSKIDYGFFKICCNKLLYRSSVINRIRLGYFIRNKYGESILRPKLKASVLRLFSFVLAILSYKLKSFNCLNKRRLIKRGSIIGFIAPEASGKTTIVNHIYNWLNPEFKAHAIHCGKPPATTLTLIPRLLIKIFIFIKRKVKSNIQIANSASLNVKSEALNLPHPLISLLDAVERYHLLKRFFRLSLKGHIVLTDRYPSAGEDSIDCRRIKGDNFILRIMSKIEKKLYSSMPHPDILFKINAPLQLTLKRNSKRINPEPKEFIRERYRRFRNIEFNNVPVYSIDNSGSLNVALLKIKRIIWDHISGS